MAALSRSDVAGVLGGGEGDSQPPDGRAALLPKQGMRHR